MIKIENISKSFTTPRGTKTVLADFSLTVKDGTFLGIAGKSGAGKSTLISIVSGLQKPDSGKVLINGIDIFSFSDKKMCEFRNKNIGFISQEQSFLENLTVLENVMLPAFITKTGNGEKKDVLNLAKKILADFGIEKLSEMYPSFLSGGENRRVLIARSLINEPEIIVADEPTDAVSKSQAKEIISIFKQLANMGKTVILVTHDETVLGLCDDILYLN
ncbi:MAG: ABC transporter ATP-binding protein [Treponema sp.]|nr:ABC transporter ATP-binding protein [Treponema sp.]